MQRSLKIFSKCSNFYQMEPIKVAEVPYILPMLKASNLAVRILIRGSPSQHLRLVRVDVGLEVTLPYLTLPYLTSLN